MKRLEDHPKIPLSMNGLPYYNILTLKHTSNLLENRKVKKLMISKFCLPIHIKYFSVGPKNLPSHPHRETQQIENSMNYSKGTHKVFESFILNILFPVKDPK